MNHTNAVNTPGNPLGLISLIVSLVGLLGVLLCCCSAAITVVWCGLFGTASVILAVIARRQVDAGNGTPADRSKAGLALIIGIVQLAIALLAIVFMVLALLGYVAVPAIEELVKEYT